MRDQPQAPPFEAFGVIRSAGMTCKTLPFRFCGGVAIVADFGLRGGAVPWRSRAKHRREHEPSPHREERTLCDELQPHYESPPARGGRTSCFRCRLVGLTDQTLSCKPLHARADRRRAACRD
jgi:hypothetical protein